MIPHCDKVGIGTAGGIGTAAEQDNVHSSVPLVPSLAVKNRFPPNSVKSRGEEEEIPGMMSLKSLWYFW